MGLVPLFTALEDKSPKAAFGLGYLTGVAFFAGAVTWFVHVTLPGMVLMVLYLALYFGIFAAGYAFLKTGSLTLDLGLAASLWTALEFLRDKLFSGFGWVSLAHSQYQALPVIQIADVTGLWGVSFLIVLVNFWLKEWGGLFYHRGQPRVAGELKGLTRIALSCLMVSLIYGVARLSFASPPADAAATVRVAVVQGNIPQSMKWDPRVWPQILQKYLRLTRAAALEKPDIIIWPETSFPGYPWEAPQVMEELRDFVREIKIPLLFGSITRRGERYYNTAILVDRQGELAQQYDKLHLVPFGEYIPLRKFLPFLEQVVPIADFTAGREFTLFPVISSRGRESRFGVLICFEDTMAKLARGFARQGAQFLVNITNDAWFMDTKEPFLHLQGAVFRAVENRLSVVRSANTGVSCFIDPRGRIYRWVRDQRNKQTFVDGFSVAAVAAGSAGTLYTKLGDVFTYLCFGCILAVGILGKFKIQNSERKI